MRMLVGRAEEADFVLLGGDLFHESKPSRSTLVKTTEILCCYCLNDLSVKFQLVSDQTIYFPNRITSAIDILSACNLVNYSGKMDLFFYVLGRWTLVALVLFKLQIIHYS